LFLLAYARGESRTNFGFHLRAMLLVLPLMWLGGRLWGAVGAVLGQFGIAAAVGWFVWNYMPTGRVGQRTVLVRIVTVQTLVWTVFSLVGLMLWNWDSVATWSRIAMCGCVMISYPALLFRTEFLVHVEIGAASTAARAVQLLPLGHRIPAWVGKAFFGSRAWLG